MSIHNKMYVVSNIEKNDNIDVFRFLSKRLLNHIPNGYLCRLHDIAYELDATGLQTSYYKHSGDSYYVYDGYYGETPVNKISDCKVSVVANIDEKWKRLKLDPYQYGDTAKVRTYLESNGYSEKHGYGNGWYSKNYWPDFRTAILYQLWQGMSSYMHHYFLWVPIDNGETLMLYNRASGHERFEGDASVNGKTVTINWQDRVFTFSNADDPDLAEYVDMVVRGPQMLDGKPLSEKARAFLYAAVWKHEIEYTINQFRDVFKNCTRVV